MGACAAYVGQLIQKVQQAKTEVPPKAGEKMLGEAKDLVAEAMGEWYGSYGPQYYSRTYDLYSGVIAGTDTSVSGNVFTLKVESGGVCQHSHDPGDYIFNGAFMLGIHGTSQIAVSTPPWEIYEPKLKELADEKLLEALEEYIASIW